MKTLLKFGVAALAASLVAGSAMAATATPIKHPAAHSHHRQHHAGKLAHKHAKHHARVAHMRRHHGKVAGMSAAIAKPAAVKMASAKPLQAAGKIQRVNAKHNTLTINHRVYRLAPQLTLSSFKPGQKVQIVYRKGHGHRMVEKISAVSA